MKKLEAQSRVSKLAAVEKQIRKAERIGSLSDPASWFAGEGEATILAPGDGMVLFFFESPSHLVALGGSARHIVGEVAPAKKSPSFSYLPSLLSSLDALEQHLNYPEDDLRRLSASGVKTYGEHPWVKVIASLPELQRESPKQRVSFLAKRLVSESYLGRRVTLGTPLFVAEE